MYSPMHSPIHTGCCVFLRRPSFSYRQLAPAPEAVVKVVVGKERRVFFVDSFVLDTEMFRVLMEVVVKEGRGEVKRGRRGVVFVNVDAILFEHMLWLVYDERSSASAAEVLEMNLKEIIEFYSQDN